MNASDWIYVAEGGKHAVFSYQPQGNVNSQWEGKVLRVDKKFISTKHFNPKEGTYEKSKAEMNHVLESLLAPYLDVPETVSLTRDFVSKLRNQSLKDGNISHSRLASWGQEQNSNDDKVDAEMNSIKTHVTATLHVNYRQLLPTSKRKCLAVEIKPKAGYTSFSPLVHPLHRAKFQYTRFRILQQLHSRGQITKGWNKSVLQQQSRYCPLDLFSESKEKLDRALEELWKCPQNNLKVWYGDELLFGHYGSTESQPSEAIYREALQSVFGFTNQLNNKEGLGFVLKDAISHILLSERLLPKLLELQCLDIVDADGAVLVYERLVRLWGGSHEAAEQLLDTISNSEEGHEKYSQALLDASPLCRPTPCVALDRYCETVREFSKLLQSHKPDLPPACLLNHAREKALGFVQELSKEECVYLLQNWLLSLTMCDVSFLVTMNAVGEHVLQGYMVGPSSRLARGQGLDLPRLLLNGAASNKNSRTAAAGIQYSVKLVDFDLKPASKVQNRARQEELIRNFSSSDTL